MTHKFLEFSRFFEDKDLMNQGSLILWIRMAPYLQLRSRSGLTFLILLVSSSQVPGVQACTITLGL